MRLLGVVLAILLAMTLSGTASAATVYTYNFIGAPTNFDGFESLGDHTNLPLNTVYSEDGIDVEYVGSGSGIWTTLNQFVSGSEGLYSWYPNAGGDGYTSIRLSSGDDFHAIQFLAGNGFAPSPVVTRFQFQLLNDGVVVGQDAVNFYTPQGPSGRDFAYYGFSGVFDEVRLQSLQSEGPFDPTGPSRLDALALDSIAISVAVVVPTPIPATLPLLLAALGGLGFLQRRRRKAPTPRAATADC